MSNRITPLRSRINGLTPRNAPGSGTPGAKTTAAAFTPGGLRHRIVSRLYGAQEQGRKSSNEGDSHLDTTLLNTAFSKAAAPTTPSTPASATPRFKRKPTALNACYTPSSLYRNTKSTPSAIATPKSAVRPTKSATKTPTASAKRRDQSNDSEEISNLTVAVRVRPLNAQECTRANVTNAVRVRGNELTVLAGTTADNSAGLTHCFSYDHVFNSADPESRQYACQEAVFAGTARPLIERAFAGYNACLFAYGQTGSGKSYSMMGIEALDDDVMDGSTPHPEAGIIPRFCRELFRRLEAVKERLQVEIEVSYFEIYNEKIHDLLSVTAAEASSGSINTGTPLPARQALKVREHPIWGPYVVDLSVHSVDSYEALRNWLAVGNSQRATAATGMNDKSSRSHSIFNIVLNLTELSDVSSTSSDTEGGGVVLPPRQMRRSKISLVDLAGSERISASGANGDRMREGVSINKSLLTLGKVIAALANAKGNSGAAAVSSACGAAIFVPYRESVLTWLLRENLGGNSKTVMLATISPASVHIDETLATLRYACQARTIVNRVKVNESPHDKIIRELRAEVDRLKSLRNDYERQRRLSANNNPIPRKIIIETSVDETEVEALRQQLAERERELNRAQKSWMERLKEAEDQRKSELRLLRRRGLALELSAEQKQACLVNLTADPILSGTLFYLLPPGVVKIGRTRTSTYASQPDIVLDGPLVAYHHCIIENENGKLYITPENEDFETYLNGELLHGRQQMFHGDRLVIGGSHYFRISNPYCTQRGKHTMVDFQSAHQEILNKQEDKLRRELEEEKRVALSRIELERMENERDFKERVQKLELEQLKFKCNREILETERKALAQEVATKDAEIKEALTYTPSFKSTLLEDINRIMQHPSEESLHKTQLMVKEATQHCRSLGVNLEFRQSQVLDEFGIFRTIILILDKRKARKAEWPTARLGVWLDIVRECENLSATNLFQSVDIDWEPLEPTLNESLNDSHNASGISLNLSIVKDALLRQPLRKLPQLFCSRSSPSPAAKNKSPKQQMQYLAKSKLITSAHLQHNTRKVLTFDEDDEDSTAKTRYSRIPRSSTASPKQASTPKSQAAHDFAVTAATHVRDMQRSALRLKKLCERCGEQRENIYAEQTIRSSLAQLEGLLQAMRSCLEHNNVLDEAEVSPSKTPKSVRFLID